MREKTVVVPSGTAQGPSAVLAHSRRRLASDRGETLVEVLAAVLVASLSVALLMGGVNASVALGRQADRSDTEFYEVLTQAEARTGPGATGGVKVAQGGTEVSIPVLLYGDEGLYAYALDPGGGGP